MLLLSKLNMWQCVPLGICKLKQITSTMYYVSGYFCDMENRHLV